MGARNGFLDAMLSDALSSAPMDPDAPYGMDRALAVPMPGRIRDAVAELVVVYGCDVVEGADPVRMFMRLHAEGRPLEDLATTMAVHARWSMRRDLMRQDRTPGEKRVDAARAAIVERHMAACGPLRGMYHPELAAFLVDMGHHWSGFHVEDDVDIPTGGTFGDLRDLMAIGGHFGHLARFVAELRLLDHGDAEGGGASLSPAGRR
jgi:hypothetical protein